MRPVLFKEEVVVDKLPHGSLARFHARGFLCPKKFDVTFYKLGKLWDGEFRIISQEASH